MIQPLYGAAALFGAGKRKMGPLFLVCIFSLVSLPAVPQETQETRRLSPDEAVDLAVKSNLDLESSRVTAGTKKRKADTAWNVFIPSIDAEASLFGLNYKPDANPLMSSPQWRFTLPSLTMSLSLNVALFEEMKNLRLDYEGGLISYEKAKSQVEQTVRKAYYNMLLMQEKIALARESVAAAERQESTARASYRAGLAPELNVLQAQVAKENLKPQLDQAENGLKTSMAQFAMQLGLPYDTQFELIPVENISAFVPLDIKELISTASSGKPDIMELKQNILLLESKRKATFYKTFTPTLSLRWGMGTTLWNDADKWIAFGDAWKSQQSGLTISLGFRLNGLLPFGSEQQGLKDIDDNLRSLRIGLAQAIRGTEVEIYSTILNLENIQAAVEARTRTVDLAERTYRLTETAYRAGLQTFLEVQNAEQELLKAKTGILEENFNYLQGLIDLEYAIGVPFGTLSGSVQ